MCWSSHSSALECMCSASICGAWTMKNWIFWILLNQLNDNPKRKSSCNKAFTFHIQYQLTFGHTFPFPLMKKGVQVFDCYFMSVIFDIYRQLVAWFLWWQHTIHTIHLSAVHLKKKLVQIHKVKLYHTVNLYKDLGVCIVCIHLWRVFPFEWTARQFCVLTLLKWILCLTHRD